MPGGPLEQAHLLCFTYVCLNLAPHPPRNTDRTQKGLAGLGARWGPASPRGKPNSSLCLHSYELVAGAAPTYLWQRLTFAPTRPRLCQKRSRLAQRCQSTCYVVQRAPQPQRASSRALHHRLDVPAPPFRAFHHLLVVNKRREQRCPAGPQRPQRPAGPLGVRGRWFIQAGPLGPPGVKVHVGVSRAPTGQGST